LRVLGLAGSPRRGGNTEQLLDRALAGAGSRGAEVEKIALCGLRLEGCRHCGGCLTSGECVVWDDMQLLYPKLIEADALVLSAPVFFMDVPAQTKAMIDRCQCFWASKYLLKRPISPKMRPGLLISVGGARFPDLFDATRRVTQAFFAVAEVEKRRELLYAGADAKGAIRERPGTLQEAFQAGLELTH